MTLFLINRHCHTGLASLCISSQSVDELRWTRSQPLSFAPPAGLADLQPEAQPRKNHKLGAPARWEHPTPSSFPWGFITKQPTIPTLQPRQLTTSTQAQISVGLSSKTPAILEAGRTPRELQEKMQARNIASSLENGAGKRRRRRCENFSYQFEVLNAADEIRRIRPATFNIYAIFKKQDFKIMEINFCASKKDHKNRINSKQPMLRKSHHFICIPCNLFQVWSKNSN